MKLSTQAIQLGYPLELVARIEAEEEREFRERVPAIKGRLLRQMVSPFFMTVGEEQLARPAFLK